MEKVFFVIFCVISYSLATPLDYQYNLISDGDGKMHVIDAKHDETEAIEPLFNAESDTRFLLFTRSNRIEGQLITWTRDSITNSNFNPDHPVRILIHGYRSDRTSAANILPTAAYLQRGDYNVIVVDWGIGANTINYVSARNRVPQVADVIARLINFFSSNGFTQTSRVIIAGHSLGAHIAGLTGKRVTNGRIQAIFGLDPAGPLFSLNSPNERFAANDAEYTEGIRTNADNLGFAEPLALADFYPNWGTVQPGCGIDATGGCAHSRAFEFFAESINSNRFVGRLCANYEQIRQRSCPGSSIGVMGGDPWNASQRGVYFLETNANSPFARG